MLSGWLKTCLDIMRSAPPSIAAAIAMPRPRSNLPAIASCCRTHAQLRGTKQRPASIASIARRARDRKQPDTTQAPSSSMSSNTGPCLDGSPVAQRRRNVSTLRRGRNALGAAVVSHRCRKNAAALSETRGTVFTKPMRHCAYFWLQIAGRGRRKNDALTTPRRRSWSARPRGFKVLFVAFPLNGSESSYFSAQKARVVKPTRLHPRARTQALVR